MDVPLTRHMAELVPKLVADPQGVMETATTCGAVTPLLAVRFRPSAPKKVLQQVDDPLGIAQHPNRRPDRVEAQGFDDAEKLCLC